MTNINYFTIENLLSTVIGKKINKNTNINTTINNNRNKKYIFKKQYVIICMVITWIMLLAIKNVFSSRLLYVLYVQLLVSTAVIIKSNKN